MKKVLLFFAAIFLVSQFNFSQDLPVVKGDKIINAGIGFGSALYSGTGWSSTIPPLSVSFEQIIMDEVIDKGLIGVGGYVGYASYKWEYNYMGYDWGYKYSNFILGARGTFHYPLIKKLDTYTGLMIGFEVVSAKEFGDIDPLYSYDVSQSGLVWSWYAGGRYFFNEKWAGMLELGYGITYLNLGVALKL
jgi:hypothetical protein